MFYDRRKALQWTYCHQQAMTIICDKLLIIVCYMYTDMLPGVTKLNIMSASRQLAAGKDRILKRTKHEVKLDYKQNANGFALLSPRL